MSGLPQKFASIQSYTSFEPGTLHLKCGTTSNRAMLLSTKRIEVIPPETARKIIRWLNGPLTLRKTWSTFSSRGRSSFFGDDCVVAVPSRDLESISLVLSYLNSVM